MNSPFQKQGGSIVFLFLVSLLALIALIGLTVDVGFFLAKQNQLQNTADAAALSCASANHRENNHCLNGDTHLTNIPVLGAITPQDTSVTVNLNVNCPKNYQSQCVEASSTTNWTTFFINAFGIPNISDSKTAYAGINQPCLLGMGSAGNTIYFDIKSGNTVNANCMMSSNSTSADAISLSGKGNIMTAVGVYTLGGISGGLIAAPSGKVYTYQSPPEIVDPYQSIQAPAGGSCTDTIIQSCDVVVSPGNYCGLRILPPNKSPCTVTLASGLYHLTGGVLEFDQKNKDTIIQGENVSFYIGDNVQIVMNQGKGIVDLTAMHYGSLANILFYQPASNNSPISFEGSSKFILKGTTYAPASNVSFGKDIQNGSIAGNIFARHIQISSSLEILDTSRINLLR